MNSYFVLVALLTSSHVVSAHEARPLTKKLRTRHSKFHRGGAQGSSSSLWADYQKALDTKPLLTKACTSLLGFGVSDALTQLFIEKKEFDLMRLAKMASFGFLIHGTTGHYFYQFLDSVMSGATPLFVAAKVAIDQTIWAPIFMVMFFTYMMLFEGTPELIVPKIKQDVWTAVRGSWMTWIPAHTINFAFVPPSQRLLYINSIQIFFNMFMSVIGNKKAA